MPVGAALPKTFTNPAGIALTFVISDQCQFNCPGCVVVQRKEARASAALSAEHHVSFVRAVARKRSITLISAQGYEPLHDVAWETTKALMAVGRELDVQTALVTNGVDLPRRLPELVALELSGITVSLDSADAAANDWSRGTAGAFDLTMAGLRAVATSSLRELALVASILRPNRGADLDGIPALLRSLGLDTWVVTAQLRFGKNSGGPVDTRENIVRELLRLERLATASGIQMLLDDEFDAIFNPQAGVIDFASARIRRLKREAGVVRLAPDGSLSYGTDILKRVSSKTVRWLPGADPIAAIERAKTLAEGV